MKFSERVIEASPEIEWTSALREELLLIEKNLEKDLSSPAGRYFTSAAQSEISLKASGDLSARVSCPSFLDQQGLRKAWREVVTDFYRQSAWGFQTSRTPAIAPKTSEQKIRSELFTYIGYAVLIVLVIKSAFSIFGLIGSNDPDDPIIRFGFWISIVLALVLTIFFVWRQTSVPAKHEDSV